MMSLLPWVSRPAALNAAAMFSTRALNPPPNPPLWRIEPNNAPMPPAPTIAARGFQAAVPALM